MAKIITGVALIAGAVVADIFAPGIAGALMTTLPGLTTGGITSAALAVGTMGAGMTLSSIAQALQGGGQALSTSIRSPLGSRVTIYGQTRVAGIVVYMSVDNTHAQSVLRQVVAWASHQCQSVDFIYLDGQEVVFNGTNLPSAGAEGFCSNQAFYDTAGNKYGFTSNGNYNVYVQYALGLAAGFLLNVGTDVASPSGDGLVWADPLWTSECTLNGICAAYIACGANPKAFSTVPGPKAAIHGKCDIYDPRLGAQFLEDGVTPNPATHVWTDNWALIIADFLVNTDFGVGCAWSEIDIDQLIAAANICDEQVELAGVSNPWQPQINASLGTQILDSNGNIETAIAVPTDGIGEAGLTAPTWPTTPGGTVVDGNITWRMRPPGPVTATWAADETVNAGYQIVDSNGNIETANSPTIIGQLFGVPYPPTGGSGTTGSTEPTWPTVAGKTVTDGTVTWTMTPANYTESRYTINGSFDWSVAPGDTLNELLAAAEGRISYQGGLWKIFPAAWYGATLSFDLGDLTGPIKWTPKRKFRDLFNAVRATFVCPSYPYAVSGFDKNHKNGSVFDGQYQPTDAPEYAQDYLHGYGTISSPYQGDANLAADAGIKLYADIKYKFVTSVATCQRLMKIRLLRNRWQGTGTLPMSLGAYQTCPQDIIQMTAAPLGWSDKYLEVSKFNFLLNAGKQRGAEEDGEEGGEQEHEAMTLGCQLEVNETDPSIYSWSTAEERSLENISSPTLNNSLQVADPTGLTLESDLTTAVVNSQGVVSPQILVSWTEPNDPFTTSGGSINVQYQPVGASSWTDAGSVAGTITQLYIPGVVAGQQYNVQIQAVHASGAAGDWVAAGPVTASAMAPTGGTAGPNVVAVEYSVGSASMFLSCAAQTVLGISIPAQSGVSIGFVLFEPGSALTPGTAYYSYWYLNPSTGAIGCCGASTSPSYSYAVQAGAGGNVSLGCLQFTTPPSGSPTVGPISANLTVS